MARLTRLGLLAVVLAGCNLPVTPWARFVPASVPYYKQTDFEARFNNWKSGKSAYTWTIQYRATALSEAALVIRSEGASSFGPLLSGSTGTGGGSFTPPRTELVKLVDDLLTTKVFDLYDGFYGAYDQGGGLIGPQLKVEIAGLVKQVSYDEDLSPSMSWEAASIQRATEAVKALGLRYVKAASASPSPAASTKP